MRTNVRIAVMVAAVLCSSAVSAQTMADIFNATADYQLLLAKQKRAEAIAEARRPAPQVTLTTTTPQPATPPAGTAITPPAPAAPPVGEIPPPPGVPGLPLPSQGGR